MKYSNILPDIPSDPKFLAFPFDNKRFVSYKSTSLETNYKHDLLNECDLGVTIDLIDPNTYAPPAEGKPSRDVFSSSISIRSQIFFARS